MKHLKKAAGRPVRMFSDLESLDEIGSIAYDFYNQKLENRHVRSEFERFRESFYRSGHKVTGTEEIGIVLESFSGVSSEARTGLLTLFAALMTHDRSTVKLFMWSLIASVSGAPRPLHRRARERPGSPAAARRLV